MNPTCETCLFFYRTEATRGKRKTFPASDRCGIHAPTSGRGAAYTIASARCACWTDPDTHAQPLRALLPPTARLFLAGENGEVAHGV